MSWILNLYHCSNEKVSVSHEQCQYRNVMNRVDSLFYKREESSLYVFLGLFVLHISTSTLCPVERSPGRVPGVGSSREQVDCFDEQRELFLIPALSSAPASSAGLYGSANSLPGLHLRILLLLQLGIHLLHLYIHTKNNVSGTDGSCVPYLHAVPCQCVVVSTCFSNATLPSSFEPDANPSFRDCRLEIIQWESLSEFNSRFV